MPTVYFPNTKEQVVARGYRLGFCKKFLIFIGFPFDVQAASSDDIYTISKQIPPILQITDDVAAKRKAQAEARAAEEAKKGRKPNFIMPGGRR